MGEPDLFIYVNYKIDLIRVLCIKKISKKVNQITDQLFELRKLHIFLDFKFYNFNLIDNFSKNEKY